MKNIFTVLFLCFFTVDFLQAARNTPAIPPVSVAVKTASYTIPAGRWARVIVNLEGSATFTIGGATALRGTQNSVLGSSSMEIYTGGQLATYSGSGTGAAYSSATDQKTVIAEIELPTGSVISGTGTWRAVVMEYLY